jgi:heme exporter protein D
MINFAFENFNEFLQMGKHGFYVWLCYGLSLLVVVSNVILYRWKKQKIFNNIATEKIRKEKQQQNYQ